jgi:hypothetical protein
VNWQSKSSICTMQFHSILQLALGSVLVGILLKCVLISTEKVRMAEAHLVLPPQGFRPDSNMASSYSPHREISVALRLRNPYQAYRVCPGATPMTWWICSS